MRQRIYWSFLDYQICWEPAGDLSSCGMGNRHSSLMSHDAAHLSKRMSKHVLWFQDDTAPWSAATTYWTEEKQCRWCTGPWAVGKLQHHQSGVKLTQPSDCVLLCPQDHFTFRHSQVGLQQVLIQTAEDCCEQCIWVDHVSRSRMKAKYSARIFVFGKYLKIIKFRIRLVSCS